MSGGPHGNIKKRLLSKSIRLVTEMVTVLELIIDTWMSSLTTSQYQNQPGTARRSGFGILRTPLSKSSPVRNGGRSYALVAAYGDSPAGDSAGFPLGQDVDAQLGSECHPEFEQAAHEL